MVLVYLSRQWMENISRNWNGSLENASIDRVKSSVVIKRSFYYKAKTTAYLFLLPAQTLKLLHICFSFQPSTPAEPEPSQQTYIAFGAFFQWS